jgi:2-(1,2-epoxy-1,2-dihydrophenyl)acetyl-CoA isomerase
VCRKEKAVELQDLLFSKEGSVGVITLNNPERMNALSPGISEGLPRLVNELQDDPEVKVIVVTGAGRAFCSGANVGGLAARTSGEQTERPRVRLPHPETGYGRAFIQCEMPVIGAINGYAVGAGFGLALSCDIRIASENAQFFVAQTRMGRRPDGGLNFLLPRIVGVQTALQLMWTADRVNAEEALRLGLVSKVVPAEDLMASTMELAERIAKGPSVAQRLAKRMVYKSMYPEGDQIAASEMEFYSGMLVDMTEDAKEGPRAFLEKREPVFKGR